MQNAQPTPEAFYTELHRRFAQLVADHGLSGEPVSLHARSLTPQEAIGETKRKDYPILTGKEVLLQAEYRGALGQAFTDAPADFTGTLAEVLQMDMIGDAHARGLFIATLNAVMRSLGLAAGTVHCKDDAMEPCAQQFVTELRTQYGAPKITLIGYQPALLSHLAENHFPLRVLDLNPDTVGTQKHGVAIEHGVRDLESAVAWADVVLCTGSTLCNGTIVNFIGLAKDVLFFGTTLAGAAELMGLKRKCFCGR